jgi:hypothetical protein
MIMTVKPPGLRNRDCDHTPSLCPGKTLSVHCVSAGHQHGPVPEFPDDRFHALFWCARMQQERDTLHRSIPSFMDQQPLYFRGSQAFGAFAFGMLCPAICDSKSSWVAPSTNPSGAAIISPSKLGKKLSSIRPPHVSGSSFKPRQIAEGLSPQEHNPENQALPLQEL